MKHLILGLALLGLFSCQNNEPTKPVEPVKVEQPKPTTPVIDNGTIKLDPAFTAKVEYGRHFIVEAIEKHGSNLMTVKPNDWQKYIKAWPTTKTGLVQFWANVLVKMAYYESKWNTNQWYKEGFKDSKGNYIYSRGLFQLSLESGLGYKCPFKKNDDLHVAALNIQCAVIILDRWVGRDKVIASGSKGKWRGGARYWAVLRGNRAYTVESLKGIQGANK